MTVAGFDPANLGKGGEDGVLGRDGDIEFNHIPPVQGGRSPHPDAVGADVHRVAG